MAQPRAKSKGRKESAPVTVIPHSVMNHPDYIALSSNARHLLMEMARQYNGYNNNGDLCAAWTLMKHRGFNSPTTLNAALKRLINNGFLIRTREGRFLNPGKQCALYAVTWKAIDECRGKRLEIQPTQKPMRVFSTAIIKTPCTETVSTQYRNCIEEAKTHD